MQKQERNRIMKIIETYSPEETFQAGKRLGEQAGKGQVYCLDGDLGVGKTVFTQGFAKGLGIQSDVNSPTFTIIQQYEEGRLPLYHSTSTGLEISARWMKSDMRTAFTEKVCA